MLILWSFVRRIGLTPRSTMEPQHPLEKAYASRIAQLNQTISDALQPTRQWLAILEVLNIAWLIVLIVRTAHHSPYRSRAAG